MNKAVCIAISLWMHGLAAGCADETEAVDAATTDGGTSGLTARFRASCQRAMDCGVLTSTVDECTTNTEATHTEIGANCPGEESVALALSDCLGAAECPWDATTCAPESAALAPIVDRCTSP